MMTYPEFQSLPRGIKKMLIASETFFFAEAQMRSRAFRDGLVTAKEPLRLIKDRGWEPLLTRRTGADHRPRLAA